MWFEEPKAAALDVPQWFEEPKPTLPAVFRWLKAAMVAKGPLLLPSERAGQ